VGTGGAGVTGSTGSSVGRDIEAEPPSDEVM
jgi:hypothetical protein